MPKTKRIWVKLVVPFFSAGITVGFIVGRATSPDYSKPATAEHFVALYARWNHIDREHGSLTLRAGNHIYFYRTGDAEVSMKFLSAMEMASNPPPKRNFDQDVEKLAAIALATPTAGILASLMKTLRPGASLQSLREEHQISFIVVAVATLGGAVIGYYLGHRSDPDYDNETFQSTLKEPKLWSQIELSWRDIHREAVNLKLHCGEPKDQAPKGQPRHWARSMNADPDDIRLRDAFRTVYELHPEVEAQVDSYAQQTSECL